jgi:NTE family protein
MLRHVLFLLSFIVITTVLISPILCHAEENDPVDRPRVGLVLAGGGAKGFAHIGVIKVLEELRVPIDYISGTSMGAIVGGFYAMGMSSEELEELIVTLDWHDKFQDTPDRKYLSWQRKLEEHFYMVDSKVGFRDGRLTLPKGIIVGQKINLLLRDLTMPASFVDDFDDLPIPFRAVGADIENGEAVILGSGDLAKAMRASMPIPGAFPPVPWDDKPLVDGGIALNLPVEVVREMGADIVIVSSLSSTLKTKEELETFLAITGQTTDFLIRHNVDEQLETIEPYDVLIETDVSGITTADFQMGEEAISIGKEAAWKAALDLRVLSMTEEEFSGHISARKVLSKDAPVIDFIRIDNKSGLSDDVIAAGIQQQPGTPLDLEVLEENLNDIYGLGYFQVALYTLVREKGRTGLVIHTRSKSWGPTFLKFGLNLESNINGQTAYNFGLRVTRTEINRLAAEWRTDVQVGDTFMLFSQFHQPLEKTLHLFLAPNVNYSSDHLEVYDGTGEEIAQYRLEDLTAGVDGGYEFGNWGEFRLGVRWGKGDTERTRGVDIFPEEGFDIGEYFLRLSYDNLDNTRFPTRGGIAVIGNRTSTESLGADYSFNRFFLRGAYYETWGRETFSLNLRVGDVHTGVTPVNDSFFLGGFLNLSGYSRRELIGQSLGFGKVMYYHRLNRKTGGIMDIPLYLGASLEAGNVWVDTSDAQLNDLIIAGSLFFGADTPIGPVFLAYGRAETDRDSFYFSLGRTF